MPPTLHPCLKRGLDFDTSPTHPSDLVQDGPAQLQDAQHESAKRKRVEAIALHYLRGKAPLILTARLKGPFNSKEWKNPWIQKGREGQTRAGKSRREQAQGRAKKRQKASQVVSPEASRAVGYTEEQFSTKHDLEPLPATAPIPDDNEHSGGTEFFSLDTERFVASNTPTNPFWLRRPAESIVFPANSQTDKSPSRIRKRDHRFSPRKSLQLAPPKEPLGHQQLPIRATPPDEWQSSASASMDMSSSGKFATATSPARNVPDSPRLREDSAQEEEARSSQAVQCAQMAAAADMPSSLSKDTTVSSAKAPLPQPPCAQSFDSLVPATTYKMSSTVQVPQSSPMRGAARVASPSMANQKLLPEEHTIATGPGSRKKQRHDLVASPAPDSSTGFMYRRVGQAKNGANAIQKAKPRAVSFRSSSPPTVAADQVLEDVPSDVVAEATEKTVIQQNEDEKDVQEEEGQKDEQESYKSRQSQYSTQAAMLLAQLEFQEDLSQSSSSSVTLRPWSQPSQKTPSALLPQLSPAITPLSVFHARGDLSFGHLASDSALDSPPISTQDLFNAASPFAFSTVKKKSQLPRRTSMRFALASKLSESTTAKTPTPLIERAPLKDKNTCAMWSFTHDKSLMSSRKRISQPLQHSANDVELPQLDLHTSLDFGPDADHTDYFLKALDNET